MQELRRKCPARSCFGPQGRQEQGPPRDACRRRVRFFSSFSNLGPPKTRFGSDWTAVRKLACLITPFTLSEKGDVPSPAQLIHTCNIEFLLLATLNNCNRTDGYRVLDCQRLRSSRLIRAVVFSRDR